MAIKLRQSTASQEIPLGYFLDSTDGDTEETGLTIANTDLKLWKMGATTLANKNSGGATHISNGIYYCVLDATDTNTLGALVIFVHVSGALAVRVECEVLPANVYDSLIAGSDYLQSDVVQLGGDTQSATDLKDFADSGYDPATNKVEGVKTVDTTTTNSDMRGTDNAALASVCTEGRLSELDAANIPADLDTLTSRLTAIRAGYLDQLDTANIPTAIVNILLDTDEIQGKLPTNNIMGSSVKTDKDDEIDALASACTEARLAELDAANIPADLTNIKGKFAYLYAK